MLWEPKTLTDELLAKRKRTLTEESLMAAVKALLDEDEARRGSITQRLDAGGAGTANSFVFGLLEAGRIFHIDQVKCVCIAYRLRFLSSALYKSTIPQEALSKIKHLEKQHYTTLRGFMVMAPSSQFHLENYDDPLLFAPIGNGYYYLIHKWGNDLNPLRKLLVRPMRDFGSLLAFLAIASFGFACILQQLFFYGSNTGQFFLIAFLFTFKSFCGIALYYCFWKGKNFNSAIWDSTYYNH